MWYDVMQISCFNVLISYGFQMSEINSIWMRTKNILDSRESSLLFIIIILTIIENLFPLSSLSQVFWKWKYLSVFWWISWIPMEISMNSCSRMINKITNKTSSYENKCDSGPKYSTEHKKENFVHDSKKFESVFGGQLFLATFLCTSSAGHNTATVHILSVFFFVTDYHWFKETWLYRVFSSLFHQMLKHEHTIKIWLFLKITWMIS